MFNRPAFQRSCRSRFVGIQQRAESVGRVAELVQRLPDKDGRWMTRPKYGLVEV
jgi:hypothetical protein